MSGFDDPLSGFLSRPTEQSGEKLKATKVPAVEETLFRSVDASKIAGRPVAAKPIQPAVIVQQGKATQVEEVVAAKTTGAAKGLGFGVDLWGGDITTKPKTSALDDLLADVLSDNLDAGIFDTKKDSVPIKASSYNVNENATGKVRVGDAVASNEFQLNDLKMATRLLEREEELDYATFGKTTHAQQLREKVVSKVQAGAVRGDLELESEDVLKKMEGALTSQSDAPLFKPTVSAGAAAAAELAATKPVEVDLASMDLDAYIASQASGSGGGGGLFD